MAFMHRVSMLVRYLGDNLSRIPRNGGRMQCDLTLIDLIDGFRFFAFYILTLLASPGEVLRLQ